MADEIEWTEADERAADQAWAMIARSRLQNRHQQQANAQASDLAADTKLLAESLAESLAIIAGLDATERGLASAERLDSTASDT